MYKEFHKHVIDQDENQCDQMHSTFRKILLISVTYEVYITNTIWKKYLYLPQCVMT